jgi:hypothetical protein
MMGLWQKAVTTFRRRTLDIKNPSGWTGGENKPAGEEVTPSGVLGLSAAWACVNLIAGTIATLPLMVYRTTRTARASSPRIIRSIGSCTTARIPIRRRSTSSSSCSRAWNSGATPIRASCAPARSRCRCCRSARHHVGRSRRSRPHRYRWSEDGQYFEQFDDTVLHIRGFGGGPLGGLSTLSFARNTFGLAMATDRAARETFRNGMRPSGQFVFKEFLTADQREQLDES